jgi:NitT/TauT family transport system substrate-binding protein
MKKLMVYGILMVLVAAMFFWSQGRPVPHKGHGPTGQPMKVARNLWPGQLWIEIADAKGWFKEAGLNVELVDTNEDYIASLRDMAEGKMDVNQFVLFDLVKFYAEGTHLVAVINTDVSNGADVILVKKEIMHINDLKGKRVGVSRGTFMEYMLAEVLAARRLSLDDLVLVDQRPEQTDMFIQGNLDGWVTYEPFASRVLSQGNVRKLFDSSNITRLITDTQAFHKSFIDARPGDVQAYVDVWHRTTEFIKENPGEAFGIIAEIYGMTPGEVQAFAQHNQILDLEDNLTAFSYGAGLASLHGAAQRINRFIKKNGITDKTLDSTEFLDGRFIQEIQWALE